MNKRSNGAFSAVSFALCASLFLLAPASPLHANASDPKSLEPSRVGDPGSRVTRDRTGVIPTEDGKTLRLTTDLGSVKVIALDPGSAMAVRYTVHIETDARGSAAEHLLDRYVLTAKATPAGVDINGTLPPQMGRSSSVGAQ